MITITSFLVCENQLCSTKRGFVHMPVDLYYFCFVHIDNFFSLSFAIYIQYHFYLSFIFPINTHSHLYAHYTVYTTYSISSEYTSSNLVEEIPKLDQFWRIRKLSCEYSCYVFIKLLNKYLFSLFLAILLISFLIIYQ